MYFQSPEEPVDHRMGDEVIETQVFDNSNMKTPQARADLSVWRRREVEERRGVAHRREVEERRGLELKRDVTEWRGLEHKREVEERRGVEHRREKDYGWGGEPALGGRGGGRWRGTGST